MKVWVKAPRNAPVMIDVPNELHALQGWVGGYIEPVFLDDDLVVICDEEGRLYHNALYNCKVTGISFYGTILLTGWTRNEDGEEDFADSTLTRREVEELII